MSAPWSCSGCDSRWGGLVVQHCPACHQTFGSTSAGDAHRTEDFHCVPPEDVGLVRDRQGVWRFELTDAGRERFAKLTAARRAAASGISGPNSPGPIPEVPPASPNPAEADLEAS